MLRGSTTISLAPWRRRRFMRLAITGWASVGWAPCTRPVVPGEVNLRRTGGEGDEADAIGAAPDGGRMRLVVILWRLLPLAVAFWRDHRRWLLFGAPARRTVAEHWHLLVGVTVGLLLVVPAALWYGGAAARPCSWTRSRRSFSC